MELTPKLKNRAEILKLTEKHCKQIIDLLLKGLSINDVVDHLEFVENRPGTYNFIKDLVTHEGKKAKRINGYYDALVKDEVKILEVDEIYQGRNSMFIGVVEKYSTYLFGLEQSFSKSIDNLAEKLNPYLNQCPNLDLIITDGLPAYEKAIKASTVDVAHLRCHVHAHRDVLVYLEPILRKSSKLYQRLKNEKEKEKKYRKRLSKSKKNHKYYQKRLDDSILARDNYYQRNNIKKYSKKASWSQERFDYKNKIRDYKTYVRQNNKAINNWEKKLEKTIKNIEKLNQKYKLAKIDALQSSRLAKAFKNLLDCKFSEFEGLYQKLRLRLKNSPYGIAKYLAKTIKNHPLYFTDKSEYIQELVKPNRANTNTIESTFGKYRLFFNHLRNIKPTKYTSALFELLRLKHNLSGPYTGPNKRISPIKRLKIKTKYNNFLESLFSQNILVG